MSSQEVPAKHAALSPTMRAFMSDWQPKQRLTVGILAALFDALGSLRRAHPEWADYDLNTYLIAGWHLSIENGRLTGARTLSQLTAELAALCAIEQPDDPPSRHHDIATAVFGVLMNSRQRQTRYSDTYLSLGADGVATHPVQSFAFVLPVGGDENLDPRIKATLEGINIFQNLSEFDPFDRAAAERYRSERMLKRRDYDEVASSVQRRATSIHAMQTEIERLQRRMTYNVREIDYTDEVIPRLDEALDLIADQVKAEERLGNAVAEHLHHHAPDAVKLQRISERLGDLVAALWRLYTTTRSVKETFEQEQDRQLFTHRRLTINPQADLLEPLLRMTPGSAVDLLERRLAALLGPRTPQVLNLQTVLDRTRPAERAPRAAEHDDPFDLGEVLEDAADETAVVLSTVSTILDEIVVPTSLPELIKAFGDRPTPHLTAAQRRQVPWALAVTVTCAYSGEQQTDEEDDEDELAAFDAFDHSRLAVVRTDGTFATESVSGDDLIVVPLFVTAHPDTAQTFLESA